MRRLILSLAAAAGLLASGMAAAADDTSGFPGVDKLPAGYQTDGGFVAGLGVPYTLGDITVLPTKPLYWTYNGKIIGYEIAIDEKQIVAGASMFDIEAMPGLPSVDHIDLEHSDGQGPWATSVWELRVEFVSNSYMQHMMAK